ncbi:MAG: hypothetical protein GY794_22790 [bacterium]|nr:hypothetical protein [bacterium]
MGRSCALHLKSDNGLENGTELRLASVRNYKDMFKEDEAGEFPPAHPP